MVYNRHWWDVMEIEMALTSTAIEMDLVGCEYESCCFSDGSEELGFSVSDVYSCEWFFAFNTSIWVFPMLSGDKNNRLHSCAFKIEAITSEL